MQNPQEQPPLNAYQAYHPSLPSLANAQGNGYENVRSDHVPILTSIPMPSGAPLKIVSWNVLEGDAFNGMSPLGRSEYGETEAQRNARYDRIATGIANFVRENNPAFITLQEIQATNDPILFAKICAALGPDYSTVMYNKQPVDNFGCVTFYNNKQCKPTGVDKAKSAKAFNHAELGGSITEFKVLGINHKVSIANVHASFDADPTHHESEVTKFLSGTDEKSTRIVIGDFNCNIAPIDTTPQNITTSATPNRFRQSLLQGACAIDGCFYASRADKKQVTVCHQATLTHLNPVTGRQYSKEEMRPLDVATLPPLQQKEMLEFRMVMCVDASYNQEKLVNGQTIVAYEKKLQAYNPNILVRRAKTLNNDSGIGIVVDSAMYQRLIKLNNPHFQFKTDNSQSRADTFYTVYTSDTHIHELTDALSKDIAFALHSHLEHANEVRREADKLWEGLDSAPDKIVLAGKILDAANKALPAAREALDQMNAALAEAQKNGKPVNKAFLEMQKKIQEHHDHIAGIVHKLSQNNTIKENERLLGRIERYFQSAQHHHTAYRDFNRRLTEHTNNIASPAATKSIAPVASATIAIAQPPAPTSANTISITAPAIPPSSQPTVAPSKWVNAARNVATVSEQAVAPAELSKAAADSASSTEQFVNKSEHPKLKSHAPSSRPGQFGAVKVAAAATATQHMKDAVTSAMNTLQYGKDALDHYDAALLSKNSQSIAAAKGILDNVTESITRANNALASVRANAPAECAQFDAKFREFSTRIQNIAPTMTQQRMS